MTDHPLPYDLLIFDADGSLRGCLFEGRPPNDQEEWFLLRSVRETLHAYDWARKHFFGIASNQGGIALGFITEALCAAMLHTLAYAATGIAWPGAVIQYCPHFPHFPCPCRKPEPGMLEAIYAYWQASGIVQSHECALYVGDENSDREAAERAGMAFMSAHEFFNWRE